MNPRLLWRPKFPEAEQCASCPFKAGNDKEFAGVMRALARKAKSVGMEFEENYSAEGIAQSRAAVYMEVIGPGGQGDFVCHATAYGPGMEIRPQKNFKQCPGASALWRKCGER